MRQISGVSPQRATEEAGWPGMVNAAAERRSARTARLAVAAGTVTGGSRRVPGASPQRGPPGSQTRTGVVHSHPVLGQARNVDAVDSRLALAPMSISARLMRQSRRDDEAASTGPGSRTPGGSHKRAGTVPTCGHLHGPRSVAKGVRDPTRVPSRRPAAASGFRFELLSPVGGS